MFRKEYVYPRLNLPKFVEEEAIGFLDKPCLVVLVFDLFIGFVSFSFDFVFCSTLAGAVLGLGFEDFCAGGSLTIITTFSAHSLIWYITKEIIKTVKHFLYICCF